MVISRGAGEERRLFPPWGLGTFPAHNTLNKEEGMSFISQYSLYNFIRQSRTFIDLSLDIRQIFVLLQLWATGKIFKQLLIESQQQQLCLWSLYLYQ